MPPLWLGRPCKQSLVDLWTYQAIITETLPDVIVELGAGMGGTSLYLASVCGVLGHGRVVTVDRSRTHHDDWIGAVRGYRPVAVTDRRTWLLGDLATLEMFDQIRAFSANGERTMLIHDADHDAASVGRDLDLYGRLVTPGCYLIVCDTNIDGAATARDKFILEHPEFVVDYACQPDGTWNPGGYLKRGTG